MKLLIFIIMFLLIGAFFIISENKLAMKDKEARGKFADLYISWANRIFENSRNMVGYIVKMDWLPGEES